MTASVRVAICHPSPIVRGGLRDILRSDPKIEIEFEIESYDDLFEPPYDQKSDFILISYEEGHNPNFALFREVGEARSNVKLLAIIDCGDQHLVTRAVENGVNGVQCKHNFESAEFLQAVHMVHLGATSISSNAMATLRGDARSLGKRKTEQLSARETEVLQLVARGKTNRDIAENLCISTRTVKFHVSSILAKLKAKNRTEAALRIIL